VTLLAFAAERRAAMCRAAWCPAAAAVDRYLLPAWPTAAARRSDVRRPNRLLAGRLAANPPHAATAVNRWDEQTDAQTCEQCQCQASESLLTRPVGITSNFCSRAFSVSALSTWNSLPAHVRSIDALSTVKRHLKFHLFQSACTV